MGGHHPNSQKVAFVVVVVAVTFAVVIVVVVVVLDHVVVDICRDRSCCRCS